MHILYCQCSNTDLVPAETGAAVLRALAESGAEVETVQDLCGMAARHDPALKRLAAGGPLRIIACHERAVRWLFAAAGAPLPTKGVQVLNLRTDGAAKVVRKIARSAAAGATNVAVPATAKQGRTSAPSDNWVPWFPVIDQDRCKKCGQCVDFCLFGTYTRAADGLPVVAHPENCKTNCPACARVCPHLAIIFPKHRGSPIDGAPIRRTDLARDDMRVGLKARSRDDMMALLKKRNQALTSHTDRMAGDDHK